MTFLPFILIRDGGLPASVLPPMRFEPPQNLLSAEEEQQKALESLYAAFDHCLQKLPESPIRTAVYNQRKRLYQRKAVQWERLTPYPEVQTNLLPAFHTYQEQQNAYRIALEQAETHWQEQYILAKDWVIAQLQNSAPLRRGLVATGSEILYSSDHQDQDKYCRAIYAYLTRAAVKTSPLSTLGTVDFLHDRFGTAMPWEDTVERFWPSLQLRAPFYWSIQSYQIWKEHLLYRINPSLTAYTDGSYDWLRYTEAGEFIAHAKASTELKQLVETAHVLPAMKPSDWLKSFPFITEDWLHTAIEAEIFIPVLPESGLDGSWAKRLLNHLAFLGPQAPESELSMLNLLTKASSQFPHMPPDALQEGLAEVKSQLLRVGNAVGFDVSELRPSDLYSHDVHIKRDRNLQPADFAPLATEITKVIKALPGVPLDQEHARMRSFAQKTRLKKVQLSTGQAAWPFLAFVQAYLKSKKPVAQSGTERAFAKWHGTWPIAAVVQCYFSKNGQLAGVLNGLSPGGGRLAGRFFTMFPEQVAADVMKFNQQLSDEQTIPVSFRQVSPTNANLHPALTIQSVDWPDASGANKQHGSLPLCAIGVHLNEYQMLELVHLNTGKSLRVLEFGLEARHEKSKIAQLFLSIGVPDWTSRLWASEPVALTEAVQFRPDVTLGNLTLQRRAWEWRVEPTWLNLEAVAFHTALQQWAKELDLPSELFYTTTTQTKPQYLHIKEPLSVELFRSNLKKAKSNMVNFTEMFPLKEQSLSAPYVSEYVLELQV